MKKNKLKIGLLISSYRVQAWFAKCVEQLLDGEHARVELVIIRDENPEAADKTQLKADVLKKSKKLCLALFNKTADITYRALMEKHPEITDAGALTDLRPALAHVPVTSLSPQNSQGRFDDSQLRQIGNSGLDVIICDNPGGLSGEILTAARHGVWSLQYGENQLRRAGSPGYWQALGDWSEASEVMLVRLTPENENNQVLYRSYSAADHMSFTHHKNSEYWKASAFVARVLNKLQDMGEEAFYREIATDNLHPDFNSNRTFTAPTAKEKFKITGKKLQDKLNIFLKKSLYYQQWFLLYDLNPGLSNRFSRYKKIMPPKDRFWADPHIIFNNDKYYIFIEEYMQASKKGHISVIEMDRQGRHKFPVKVLEKDHHLSYPYVFEAGGDYYMIPETASNRTIELYKSSQFPFKWEWQMNLMEDVYAVDTTLYFDRDRWWLFANMVETQGASSLDELFIFYSDDFRSTKWQPHKQNPVISDVRKARPAGAIFEMNGNLYRPSQNCAHRYGYGFNINHITRLDPEEYREVMVSQVKPNWQPDLQATHTFNKTGELQIIDALASKFKFGKNSDLS
ncbi:hypothetical protein SG34_027540 [Thalassomonas viridans]|uniref:Glucosamine inositolphosphorylceramide transferase 1 N-terminal domain-containing protein n=1 Tax=Thalassomonas viridans TaxID=137584 RepID=A0AAE9Z4J8_9GAMM|nr:hypothetical protein [Thalassomonas viridans]WDE05012.1 hypothetical protein SG34_027540 [Thalassomonas viridans]